MSIHKLCGTCAIIISFVSGVLAQDPPSNFLPALFWGANSDTSILLAKPSEMLLIDTKGIRHGKIQTTEPITSASLSPDGKKLLYTTLSGLWLVKLETKETLLVAPGNHDYLRWNSDSACFMFAAFVKIESDGSTSYTIRLFWADGDGKNLKQVYP